MLGFGRIEKFLVSFSVYNTGLLFFSSITFSSFILELEVIIMKLDHAQKYMLIGVV